jgi:hypothetical protein
VDWTSEAILARSKILGKFGSGKRGQLMVAYWPIRRLEEAHEKLEEAKVEYEKWVKKMDLPNQEAEAFDEDCLSIAG